MHFRPVLLLLILLKAFSSFAFGADTVKVFYDINKYALSPTDMIKINTLVKSVGANDTVKIIGYADYLGNDKTNLILSEKRAETVFDYLLSLPKSLKVITEWVGGVPASSKRKSTDGEPQNRRVDIIKAIMLGNKNPLAARAAKKPPARMLPIFSAPEDRRPFKVKINDLDKIKVGGSLSLQEITFPPGRHFLNPEAVPCVDTLLKYLKKHNNLVFEIQGHICCVYNEGDSYDYDAKDVELSTNRAKFIYDYFLQKGISATRMTYKGLGSLQPKVWPERSEHDRYLNRRVEIMVVGK